MKKIVFLISFQLSILSFQYSYGQWQQTSCPTFTINCIDTSGTNIYAGSYGGGVFLSTDKGTSWIAVNNGLLYSIFSGDTSYYNVKSLAIRGKNILAGTYDEGVFLSTNNGARWDSVNNGLTHTIPSYIMSLTINDSNIFAGTLESNGEGGIYLSTNNGASWNALNNGISNNSIIYSFAINDTNIFAGTYKGVYLSTDNGGSWNTVDTGLTNTDVFSLAICGTNIFAGTNYGGVFLSTNNGGSWKAVNTGLNNNVVESLAITGINIFAGTYVDGIFLTTNNGASWIAVNNGLPTHTTVYSIAINGGYIFAGTDGGIWKRSLSDILGVNELGVGSGEIKVKVYPNPATNYLYVSSSKFQVSGLTCKYVLTLRNIEGQEVVKENVEFSDVYKLDLRKVANGIYFLTVQNDEVNYVNKVVIQK